MFERAKGKTTALVVGFFRPGPIVKAGSEEVTLYCTNCGSEVSPDDAFCTSCGAEVKPVGQGAPAAATPPAPPAQPAAPPPAAAVPPTPPAAAPVPPVAQQPPEPPPGTPAAKPEKKKKKWLAPALIGVALVLVAAVIVVLVVVVFGGGGPQATVNDLYKAMEKGDSSAVVALVDTSELSKQAGLDAKFKEYVQKNMPSGVKFSDLKFETTVNGNNATVKTVSGKVSGKDKSGKTVTVDITKSGGSNTTYLVKKDGKWYLDTKTFPEFYATEYLKEADAALDKLGTDTKAELNNIDNAISAGAQGVTSMQELDARFKAQVPGAEKTIADLKKQAEDTKAKYKSVENLEGVKDYKAYASLRAQDVDVVIEMLDKLPKFLDELGGYLSGLAANPPTTQAQADAAVQGVNNIVNSYATEFEALKKKGDDLESQANQLKETLGL